MKFERCQSQKHRMFLKQQEISHCMPPEWINDVFILRLEYPGACAANFFGATSLSITTLCITTLDIECHYTES